MYKKAGRFIANGRGRDTGLSPRMMRLESKPTRQELLLAAGMRADNEEIFMALVQRELRKMVKKGIKHPRHQADLLNKMEVLAADGRKWDAARIVTFYERQKTRLTRSGPIEFQAASSAIPLDNPVLTPELAAKLKSLA